MSDKKHLFVHFETVGNDAITCVPIMAHYVSVKTKEFLSTPYSFEGLLEDVVSVKLSLDDARQKLNIKKLDQESVSYWAQSSKKNKKKIIPSQSDVDVEEFMKEFVNYVSHQKVEYWWSRAANFSPVILYRLANAVGCKDIIDEKLKFYLLRDMRTFIDAKFNFSSQNNFIPVSDVDYWNETFDPKDGLHVLVADILRIQTIFRAEADLDQTER